MKKEKEEPKPKKPADPKKVKAAIRNVLLSSFQKKD